MTSANIIRKFNALHNRQVSKSDVEKLLSEVNAFIKVKRVDSHGPEGEKIIGIKERLSKLLPRVNGQDFKLRIDPKVKANTPVKVIKKIVKKVEKKLSGASVIGKTKSGKAIYNNFENKSHDNFTVEDHNDAIVVNRNLKSKISNTKKGFDKIGDDDYFLYKENAEKHKHAAIKLLKSQGLLKGTKKYKKKSRAELKKAVAEKIPVKTYQATSSKNLSGVNYKYHQIELGPFEKDYHRMYSDSVVQLHGLPGHGKTVHVMKVVQDRAERTHDNILYVAREEYGRSEFDMKLKEQSIGHKNLRFRGNLDESDLKWATVVVLDSVNALELTPLKIEKLMHQFPNRNWFLILQSTKDGKFRGSQEWEHLVTIAGEIRNRKLILSKNRLDPDNKDKAEKIRMDSMVAEKTEAARIREKVKYEATKHKVETEN